MGYDFIALMRKLAPDLIGEMARRALILERISAMQPVGRRQLAVKLNITEREIRNTSSLLKDMGYIELSPSGMTLTPKAEEILDTARRFSREMSGLTEMENLLASKLPADRVVIAPGNADEDPQVIADVGRLCAVRLRGMLQNGNTLAVTGGRTMAAVAKGMQSPNPLNIMVVPARGGLGGSVETQANTLAEEIAGRLGGHYRLIHLPDHLDNEALREMLKLPEVCEAMEFLNRADIVLHGIGKAEDSVRLRGMSHTKRAILGNGNARGECFGSFFDIEGKCLFEASGIVFDPAKVKPSCRFVAAAAGESKAEAIISVLRNRRRALLVTDQGAAERILALI